MGAIISFPRSARALPVGDQRWSGPLPRNVQALPPRVTRLAVVETVSAERLMLLAIFFAMGAETRETARAFLAIADPTRSHPATVLVEQMMRRIRQLG